MVDIETCDDGSNNGDGCLIGCSGVADGWECTHTQGLNSVCTPICGDGQLLFTELCDDGPSDHNPPYAVKGCLPDCSGPD